MQRPSLTSLTRKAGAVTALALGLLVSGAYAKIDDSARYEPVAPTIDQARANILIARQLQFTHFRNLGISDELSGDVFDAYLNYLDGQRIYLSQDDIAKFDKIRTQLGSALK